MLSWKNDFYLGLLNSDANEHDISFEELKDNDHLRVQKRQIGGTTGGEKEQDETQKDTNIQSTKINSTDGSVTIAECKDKKSENEDGAKDKKKPLFDSDLVQLDLFSPFPISLFHSNYLYRSLQRIMFKENKIVYLKGSIKCLCNMNLFKKIFVYMFWIVYVLKFQKTDKQEILCELKIALRDKLRKLFILLPSPKDKYYELIPLILSLAIEITLNSEVTTITEKKSNVTSPPKNTYDYE
jgi:hypothetical protein